jgi:hypothetical protein
MLTPREATEVRSFIENVFSDDRYVDRVKQFSEGVLRRAASYGLTFDPAAHRVDLPESAYRAGAMNALRRARANVLAEIELNNYSRTPDLVRHFSQWWVSLRANPWMSIAAAIVLVFIPWLVSKIGLADMLNRLSAWWQ